MLHKYWTNRTTIHKDLAGCEIEFFNAVLKEFKEKPKSIIDFGCGFGRGLGGFTTNIELYGVDFSLQNIRVSHSRFPQANLVAADLQNLPFITKFDLGLCLRVLQHIPHNAIARVVENIKSTCNAVILEEGVNVPEDFYQFNHDYETLFEGWTLKKKQLEGTNPYTHFFFFVAEVEEKWLKLR